MAKKILYAILILLVLYLGYWFYQNYRWVEESREVGFQGIAKRKPLLAAEFFLRKMGIKNQPVNGLIAFRKLEKQSLSILIATRRQTLNPELSKNLLQWLEAGGHLIVEARNCDSLDEQDKRNSSDFVFQRFGVCTQSIPEQEDGELPIEATLNNYPRHTRIKLLFPYWEILQQHEQPADANLIWTVEDKLGQYVLQYRVGNGVISILTTTDIFTNEYIDQYDHARLLLELVQPQGTDNEVWLVSVDDMPSLWNWLWQNAWHVMFSLSLLFLLWLWRYPLRFGPILEDQATARRKLQEHIEASAYYRWHNKQLSRLLASVQEEVWEQVQKMHPVIHRDKQQQAFSLLEEITRVKKSDIKNAFMPLETMNEAEFEQKVKVLVSLRNKL